LKGIGHVNLRGVDQEVSKRFYRDLLGFVIAEEDPEHGGVFMTLGDNFHTLDIGQHPAPETAQRPKRGQIGLGHIAFQVGNYAALRDTYAHLVGSGVEILRPPTTSISAASISPIQTATRWRSIRSCRTRWSCSPRAGTTRKGH
jgi:catechol 2,3-dioxygenase-like lactoylglutathione lyase family enzyme